MSFWLYPLVYYSVSVRLLFAYWIIGARVTFVTFSYQNVWGRRRKHLKWKRRIDIIKWTTRYYTHIYKGAYLSLSLFLLPCKQRESDESKMDVLCSALFSLCVYTRHATSHHYHHPTIPFWVFSLRSRSSNIYRCYTHNLVDIQCDSHCFLSLGDLYIYRQSLLVVYIYILSIFSCWWLSHSVASKTSTRDRSQSSNVVVTLFQNCPRLRPALFL